MKSTSVCILIKTHLKDKSKGGRPGSSVPYTEVLILYQDCCLRVYVCMYACMDGWMDGYVYIIHVK